jgi:uncharacterized protein YbaR (Trm112 family)
MKRLFKLVVLAGLVGGIVYIVKQVTSPPEFDMTSSGGGVLPTEPITSLDEAPLGGEVSDELLKILVCPEDKGSLELVDDGKFLLNPRNGYKYPIRNGIPVMLIEEGKKYQDKSLIRSNGSGESEATAEGEETA